MRRAVILLYVLLLGIGLGPVEKDETQVRPIEIGEFHRTIPPETVAALDADAALGARAALAIGRTKRPEGAAPLRAQLHVADPGERAMVVYALGLLADGESLADVRAAEHDANSAVRYAAVDALGRIYANATSAPGREAADDLLATATHDADPVVRGHALANLDAFRKAPFAREIVAALEAREARDPDPSVRWHAAWMLFRGYAAQADLAVLAREAKSPDEYVRVETARALGHRAEHRAIDIARSMLDDPSWHVQFDAREAVRRLLLLPATQHLRRMPAGIHLPPVAKAEGASTAPAAPPSAKPVAPDPQTFALAAPYAPRTASEMNGPAPGPHPRVRLRTTTGDAIVRLYPEWAPSTVANFLALVDDGYFNGNRWFRIVPDFVDQTGDPTNTGDGDAGYTIPAEENPIEQRTGIIAMGLNYDANGAERDSAGTQFYITLSPQLHLDRAFSVFGEVQSGFDALANMDERALIVRAERISDR